MEGLIKEWKFIAGIPPNSKPCYIDKCYFSTSDWFLTLRRRWKNEKGEKGVTYVENLIELTKLIEIGLKEIEEALVGLENLVNTYKNDGQCEVAEGYEKCIEEIKKLIDQRQRQPKPKMKPGFFQNQPTYLV